MSRKPISNSDVASIIADLQAGQDPFAVDALDLALALLACREENDRLRTALKPFAARVDMFSTKIPDHQIVNDDFMFTAGDFRSAARLLKGDGHE